MFKRWSWWGAVKRSVLLILLLILSGYVLADPHCPRHDVVGTIESMDGKIPGEASVILYNKDKNFTLYADGSAGGHYRYFSGYFWFHTSVAPLDSCFEDGDTMFLYVKGSNYSQYEGKIIVFELDNSSTETDLGLIQLEPLVSHHNLEEGWNLIGYSLSEEHNASEILRQCGCDSIAGYVNNGSQEYFQVYSAGLSVMDFPLETGKGYLVHCNEPGELYLFGTRALDEQVQLNAGWNLIDYINPYPLTSSYFLDKTVGPLYIADLRREEGDAYYVQYEDDTSRDRFNLQTDKGYFLYAPVGVSLPLSTYVLYEQDNGELSNRFYKKSDGLDFLNYTKYYFGQKGTYLNIISFLGTNYTPQHIYEYPSHTQEEHIGISYDNLKWFEEGLGKTDSEELILKTPSSSLSYVLDADELPIDAIYSDDSKSTEIDLKWRGKMIFFGEEYYVKDIFKNGLGIRLVKGKYLEASSTGFSQQYMGYRFRVDHIVYSADLNVAGLVLDVEKPDGSIVPAQVSRNSNAIVDDIEILGIIAEDSGGEITAQLRIYDTTNEAVLQDGKEVVINGEVKDGWRVELSDGLYPSSPGVLDEVGIEEYKGAYGQVLKNITITKRGGTDYLSVGESIEFPLNHRFTFAGLLNDRYTESKCIMGFGGVTVDENNRLRLPFSTGELYPNSDSYVNLAYVDQGPFEGGEIFIANGKIYEFHGISDQNVAEDDVQVEFIDLPYPTTHQITLSAVTSGVDRIYIYPRTQADESMDYIQVSDYLDADPAKSQVYAATTTFAGGYTWVIGDYMYFLDSPIPSEVNNEAIDILPSMHEHPYNVYDNGNVSLTIKMLDEASRSYYPDLLLASTTQGVDLNFDGDYDDVLIEFKNHAEESLIVDMYDRHWNASNGEQMSMGIYAVKDADLKDGFTPLWTINNPEDGILWLPEGGSRGTIQWENSQITSLNLCQPTEQVYPTTYLSGGFLYEKEVENE
ncbi:MAG: hypothetical protein GF334_13515 [Candidatus Altiarchaeales archaeon]|nr:hypothetical protein [Candidatus Altiarchaeales archaeon]